MITTRRRFLAGTLATALLPITNAPAFARPKRRPIRIGFIPLTDCATVVLADVLGLYSKYGVNVEVIREKSWSQIRDKLLSGQLDAAHCLFSMPFSVYTGIGGKSGNELKVAMMLSNNGQAITLEKSFSPLAGYGKRDGLKEAIATMYKDGIKPIFGMTFPGGTHDIWLRYALAAAEVPFETVKFVTIPPPKMIANIKARVINGYCVGEPWNGYAVKQDVGYTYLATQDIWNHHPEKALVVNPDFAENRREELKRVMKALLEASHHLDVMTNRRKFSAVLGSSAYVDAPPDVINARLEGIYNLGAGLGEKRFTENFMRFSRNGQTNFPRKSHAIWFLSQFVRFGYLDSLPDTQAIADRLILQDLYREVAHEFKKPVPDDDMQPFTLKLDNARFDPKNPAAYLRRHRLS